MFEIKNYKKLCAFLEAHDYDSTYLDLLHEALLPHIKVASDILHHKEHYVFSKTCLVDCVAIEEEGSEYVRFYRDKGRTLVPGVNFMVCVPFYKFISKNVSLYRRVCEIIEMSGLYNVDDMSISYRNNLHNNFNRQAFMCIYISAEYEKAGSYIFISKDEREGLLNGLVYNSVKDKLVQFENLF